MKKIAEIKVSDVLTMLFSLKKQNPIYESNYDDLIENYNKLKVSLEKSDKNLYKQIEWSKWFAPRIVYDGTGEVELQNLIGELNKTLEKI